MAKRTSKGLLLAALVWIIILGALGLAYRLLIHPHFAEKLEEETGSDSRYRHKLKIAADSFSGYCILRSEAFKSNLKSEGILPDIVDDGADYNARIKALREGKTQMAVFTIDSLISSSAHLGEFPATIVLVIDESRGADAIIAKKGAVSSIQDLDASGGGIVLTPNSPSDFLARIVVANFSLPRLPQRWSIAADGAAEVYARFRSASGDEKRAYVLWEPYLSRAVDEGARVLLDSSRLKGYIVDVLTVQREFLRDSPDVVKTVIGAYLRAAYAYRRDGGSMAKLLQEDARSTGGEALTDAQAAKMVSGIRWKNTLENYAHFGLLPDSQSRGTQHLEDMINNIIDVLVKTGALGEDPLRGNASNLFYDRALGDLKSANFHPGRKISIIKGAGLGPEDLQEIEAEGELQELSDTQWDSIVPVGELVVEPISFGRGGARINISSRRELKRIAGLLKSWPRYYLIVVGHTRAEGDQEANRRLARERGEAAAQALVSEGISKQRIKTRAAKSSGRGGESQAVTFTVGQLPY